MIRGVSRVLIHENELRRLPFLVSSWKGTERAAFEEGLADSVALYLLAHYNRFAWPEAVDRGMLEAALIAACIFEAAEIEPATVAAEIAPVVVAALLQALT